MRFLIVVALVLAAACGGVPSRAADIEGVVTEVDFPGTGTGSIVIHAISTYSGDPPPGPYGDKALVRITDRTKIYRDSGGVLERIPFREVLSGPNARAKAWFTGPVAESYPVQAEAETILYWTVAP